MAKFDLIVLGSGSAGMSAARWARHLGASVASARSVRSGRSYVCMDGKC